MLTVDVELLTGRYVATRFNDRNRVEWPPHPARLFSAAVAAWADADKPSAEEREALLWWEALGPPDIECSWDEQWSERAPVTHYVPVNDTQVVGRDTSGTYRKLRTASDELAHGAGDSEKARDRLHGRLAKAGEKASTDSLRVAASGTAPLDALKVLPDKRGRQARVYPTAVPSDQVVTYTWTGVKGSDDQARVLDGLLARIARLGHSSSLVSVAARVGEPGPTTRAGGAPSPDGPQRDRLSPNEDGRLAVRVAGAGQLKSLESAYASHQGTEPRILAAEIVTYALAGEETSEAPRSVFGSDWIVVEPAGRKLSIRDTLGLTRTLRQALMHHSPVQPAPEVITGHRPGSAGERTAPTDRAHLAVAALPFVAHPHADGSLQGLALLVPGDAEPDARQAVLQAAGQWLKAEDLGGGGGKLTLGKAGVTAFRRSRPEEAPSSARPTRWTRSTRRWASVTPIALDRHPGDLNHRDPDKRRSAVAKAEELVRIACRHIGLPAPVEVAIGTAPLVTGTRKVGSFPPYAVKGGRLRRSLVHAELIFDAPVRGPVLIGAGRYLGYGLCAPLPDHKATRSNHG